MQHILVGVDGSEASTKAARLAAEIASRFGARLTLAHAVPRLVLPPDAYGLTAVDVDEEHRAFGERLLAHALTQLGEADVSADSVVLDGAPAECLADAAKAKDVDLVVVGSHGRGAVARMLLGSVTDRLVHICSKPVLVVR